MGIEAVSGICATTGSTPNFTFVWSASEQSTNLVVTCTFGGGTAQDNYATATIPWSSTSLVKMTNQQNNPAIAVSGSVQAMWSSGSTSYVVLFTGAMVETSVNNVFSSSQNGGPTANPIIVAAYISS